jgi:hypothetical protein
VLNTTITLRFPADSPNSVATKTPTRPNPDGAILQRCATAYNGAIGTWRALHCGPWQKIGIAINMLTSWMSNVLLLAGVVMLCLFGILQVTGNTIDPLVPATAAFLIGCTAVIDRVGSRKLN